VARRWRAGTRQPQYHKRFGIYQSFLVNGSRIREWRAGEGFPTVKDEVVSKVVEVDK
jgi:hypothetical protein